MSARTSCDGCGCALPVRYGCELETYVEMEMTFSATAVHLIRHYCLKCWTLQTPHRDPISLMDIFELPVPK